MVTGTIVVRSGKHIALVPPQVSMQDIHVGCSYNNLAPERANLTYLKISVIIDLPATTEANIDAATWKTKMKAMIATAQAAATSRKLTLVQVITS